MVGFKNLTDGAVYRCDNLVTSWLDGNTVTDDFLCEYDIRNIFNIDDFTGQRGNDFDAASVFLSSETRDFNLSNKPMILS